MRKEFRIFGPPGCGKTTHIVRQIRRAILKYDRESIYAMSFTKAAAAELNSRGTGLPAQNVGTIHALCSRALGGPTIVEVESELKSEWIRGPGRLFEDIKLGGINYTDMAMDASEGDIGPLGDYNVARCCNVAPSNPRFVKAWEEFKKEHEAMDFTDLLLNAPEELKNCKVLIVDEAQDLSPLQWEVVRRWGSAPEIEHFVVAGDDDQTIYSFTGANAAEMLRDIDKVAVVTLDQSWRLPSVVHAYADKFIKKVKERQPKEWAPAREGGEVKRLSLTTSDSEAIVDLTATLEGSTMILASCGYMLRGILATLRRRGVCYWNPFKRDNPSWNPLRQRVTFDKVAGFWLLHEAFKSGDETILRDTSVWRGTLGLLRAKDCLHFRGKTYLANCGERVGLEELSMKVAKKETMTAIVDGNFDWLTNRITGTNAKLAGYPLAVLRKYGLKSVDMTPKIIIGSIHSVKGGEADNVILFPDVSKEAHADMCERGRKAIDDATRLMYVGATRTKDKLFLCEPTGRYFVQL